MMSFKLTQMLPCTSFFNEGRMFLGLLALLMQVSLILWPIAAQWANKTSERSGVERLLAELSETHRRHIDPYAMPTKKFRQLA